MNSAQVGDTPIVPPTALCLKEMATNTVPSQFLKLPDDILLEILAQLPAFQVVLRCRPVSPLGSNQPFNA